MAVVGVRANARRRARLAQRRETILLEPAGLGDRSRHKAHRGLVVAALGCAAVATDVAVQTDTMELLEPKLGGVALQLKDCLLYTSPSPRDRG